MFGSKEARKNLREAQGALEEYSEKKRKAGDREEDATYNRLNSAAHKAHKELKDSRKRR